MSLPDDYFLDTDDEMLEYLEDQAKQSIAEIQKSNEQNREKAYRLLNYLIAGIGAVTLILLNHIEKLHIYFILASIICIAGWSISAVMLLHYIILSKKRPLTTNMPQNLYNDTFKSSQDKNKLGILRRYELHNANQYIIQLLHLNNEYRRHTDKAIMLSFSIPVATALIVGISA
ncbi:Uncharacterised protein [Avibacterium paragallinarum]|uniref:Uncharacterized protein n=2 Tax=Avibacterium paragallinarum TaxID=728 RepID=A0A377IUH7_AVIPA|nr:hypothetical protein [Avibacterium paragallinarum]STO73016.1 Uncharacterised protein [Avibacterium paragallinarum]STO91862.1 Uncharacterised protein [Avibacterium paragallinarum]